MRIRPSTILAALVLCAVFAGPGFAQSKDEKLDLVIKGALKADDPKDKVTKQPSKVHTVQLRGGQAYVITMEAVDKGLDPFLRVEDSAGKELAQDDDSGGFPNSRIQLKAPRNGAYRLIATAYEGTGEYILRIRAGELTEDEKLAAEATSLYLLAMQFSREGKQEAALEKLNRALAILENLYPATRFPDGHPDIATILHNLGFIRNSVGQTSKALPDLERALAMREKLYSAPKFPNGHPDLATSLRSLGAILKSLGRANDALPYMERALAMADKLYPRGRFPDGHPDLAASLNNLGFVLHSLGEASKALPYYERALVMREKLYPATRFPEGHPDLAQSLSNVGGVLQSLGQASKALAYDERALAMDERLYPAARFRDGHPELATSLDNMGIVLAFAGQASKALAYCERALAMREKLYPPSRFPDGHPDVTRSLNNLGFVLESLGQASKALPHYERALAMQRRLLARGIVAAAEAEAFALVRSLPRIKDSVLSLAKDLPDEPPRRFYSQLWESRAILTRILQVRHEAIRVALLKDETAKKTWDRLQSIRRELGGLLLADREKVKDRDQLVRDLTDKKEKLEAELAKVLPELERPKQLAKLGPKHLADKLPKDTVLLDFIRYQFFDKGKAKEQHYVVFVVAPKQDVQMISLGAAPPIDDAIRQWRKHIEGREPSKAPEVLAKLVWRKIAPHLPKETKTLYIAPDGDLTRLPFAALPVGRIGNPAHSVLLEDYLIAYVPHAPFVLEQLMFPVAVAKPASGLLAVGEVPYSLAGIKDELDPPWPELKATGPEIRQLANLDTKREVIALTGAKATVAEALAKLPQVGYAHFATHGFFEDKALADERKRVNELLKHWEFRAEGTKRIGLGLRNPLSFTGLVLAGANAGQKAGKDGGILSSEAIVELPLEGLRLAVLSACETGLGELTEGEGVQGLQRAFHLAGCPNVVASLWKVNDAATAALMNKFYHEMWVNNRTPIEALRLAQLTIYRHPELIPALAGERGRPDLDKAVRVQETAANSSRADTKLWAAFVLSGLGR